MKPAAKLAPKIAPANTTGANYRLMQFSLLQMNRLSVLRQVGKLPAELADDDSFAARMAWEREQFEEARAAFLADRAADLATKAAA